MKYIMPVKKQMQKKDATDQSRLRDILFFLLVLFHEFNRIVIHSYYGNAPQATC